MFTTKRQFVAIASIITVICLCFMVTIVNQRNGISNTSIIKDISIALESQKESDKEPDSNPPIKDRKDILDFIHKQCKKYHRVTVGPGEAERPRKMVLPKNWRTHRMVYAGNPKAGSSSFKRWIHVIQGDTRPYDDIKHVHQMGKYGKVDELFRVAEEKLGRTPTLMEATEDLFKVTVVRNPVTKLLSGYRDKVERVSKTGIRPSMYKFNPDLTVNSTKAEKYKAFVQAVTAGKLRNHHFTPQWNKMKICDFPYDAILQTETANQQIEVVQEHTNTSQYVFPGSRAETGGDQGISTLQRTRGYYSLFEPELMDKLYNFFLWDFVLMGYSKLDNPNFPHLDFDQDIEKEFGHLLKHHLDLVTANPGTDGTNKPTAKP